MTSRWAFILAFAAFLVQTSAFAQTEKRAEIAEGVTIAGGPATPPLEIASDDPFVRFFVKLDGGLAFVGRETVGGFARLGGEAAIVNDPTRSRFVWGLWDAYEGWFAKDAGGFALPIVAYVGYRKAPFLATVGGGLNVFTVDHLDHDTGFGIFSPRGDLRVGIDFDNVAVMAHSDIQYRWLWGRDDISLIQVGLSIGVGQGFQREEPAPQRKQNR